METEETREKWTSSQIAYINFLAAFQIDSEGNKWSKDDFARKVLKVNPDTLYAWQKLPGFYEEVAELSPSKLINRFYPQMIAAQIDKAIKKKDTPAFLALARQGKLLKSDKQDINQSGEMNVTITTVDYANATDTV